MTEEEQLMMALALSATEHQERITTLRLDSQSSISREELCAARSHSSSWVVTNALPGKLCQFNIFNQFHSTFAPLINEYGTAQSLCGYLSTTLVKAITDSPAVTSEEHLAELLERLRDVASLKPHLARVMDTVRKARLHYIERHPASFTEREAANYLKAWVANYEISDCLRIVSPSEQPWQAGVIFLRFNQSPEQGVATHEEKERLEEEKRFGGNAGSSGGSSRFEPGDSVFVVETFAPNRSLMTPWEWNEKASQVSPAKRNTELDPFYIRALVLDLNGHFCVALPMRKAGAERSLVIINTTEGDYLRSGPSSLMCSVAFDLCFHPDV